MIYIKIVAVLVVVIYFGPIILNFIFELIIGGIK